MVICAPTGSGKTVLFELAMIRFLEANGADDSKCIYVAPTKVIALYKHCYTAEAVHTHTGSLFREIQALVPKVPKYWD